MAEEPPRSKKNSSWFKRLRSEKKEVSLEQLQEDLLQVHNLGLMDHDLTQMVQAIINAGELTVRDIMVPRAKIVTLHIDEAFDEMLTKIVNSGHSRFPVLSEDHEEMVGILLSKDLLRKFGQQSVDISTMLRPIVYIPEGKYVTALLHEFRERRSHLALAVDEYGAVSGLITIEDILEQIVGEIDDEHDHLDDKRQIKKLGDNRFIVDAMIRVDEFNELFKVELNSDEVETLSGLLMTHFGTLPKENDEIQVESFHFRVLPYDGKCLNTLEMTILPEDN